MGVPVSYFSVSHTQDGGLFLHVFTIHQVTSVRTPPLKTEPVQLVERSGAWLFS